MNIESDCTNLMKQNYSAVGFLPNTEIREAINENRLIYLYNNNELCGYILTGRYIYSKPLHIYQLVAAKKRQGYGCKLFALTLTRARLYGVTSIILRCADGLESNKFWLAMGFEKTQTYDIKNQRNRKIHRYCLDIAPRLF